MNRDKNFAVCPKIEINLFLLSKMKVRYQIVVADLVCLSKFKFEVKGPTLRYSSHPDSTLVQLHFFHVFSHLALNFLYTGWAETTDFFLNHKIVNFLLK